MHIKAGYEIAFDCPQPTPMLLVLSVHPSRVPDLVTPQQIAFDRDVIPYDYVDSFGNVCTRIIAPAGRTAIRTDFVIADSGLTDRIVPDARQHDITELPNDALLFLLGSRYCETDRLSDTAWSLFGNTQPGWARVQAICDYVHDRIAFGYEHANPTSSAWHSYVERKGVCRDYAHLAITFCRCMNIPARYCTGYLGDIGVPSRRSDGFQRVVRGLPERAVAHVRCAQQHASHRPHSHGARARRDRCRDLHLVRPEYARQLQCSHRRGYDRKRLRLSERLAAVFQSHPW